MKCTGKEWDHCRVEKMGCIGCHYDEIDPDEYIRTESGDIFIVDAKKKVIQAIKFLDVQYGKIIKHSKKIKDIIGYKDLVVYEVNGRKHKGFVKEIGKHFEIDHWSLDQIKILKIITRERLLRDVFDVEKEKGNESI